MPPLLAGRVTVRVRIRVPPPHIRLHSLHSLQALTSQSTGMGQGSLLQARVSMSSGQAMPPLPGCWRTVRLRVWVPPPHVLLHSLQLPQSLTRQSAPAMQAPSRQTPPGHGDSLGASEHDRLLALQLRQGPAQLAALQVPVQLPPWHSARFPVHVSGVQVGAHMPPLHRPPGQPVLGGASTHWSITQTRQGPGQLLAVQLFPRQIPMSRQLGAPAGQASVRSTHSPLALQTRSTRLSPPPQRAAPHDEPTGSRWQPPLPSQPLVQAPAVHIPAGSAPPTGTLAHVPSWPGRAHERHDPLQAPAQHRPWAHCPLAHWVPALQMAPLGRLPQLPITQLLPAVHWLSLPQLLAQPLPLQPRWGAQLRPAGTAQRPA
jgi:hypothetical protein